MSVNKLKLLGNLILVELIEPVEENKSAISLGAEEVKPMATTGIVKHRSPHLSEEDYPYAIGDLVHFDGYTAQSAPPFNIDGVELKVMEGDKLYGWEKVGNKPS